MKSYRHNSKVHVRYLIKLSLLALLFITAICIGFLLFQLFFKPNRFLTVAIINKSTMVFFYDKKEQKAILLTFPENIKFNSTYNYGMYNLKSLARLDEIEKAEGEILISTLEESLALPVKYYIVFNQDSPNWAKTGYQAFEDIFNLFKVGINFRSFDKSNINLLNFFEIAWKIRSVPVSNLVQLNLNDQFFYDKSVLPDGSSDLIFNQEAFDRFVKSNFALFDILEEQVNVAVVNTTSLSGLGSQAARKLKRFGLNVVRIENEDIEVNDCHIIINQNVRQTSSLNLISGFFNCSFEKSGSMNLADIIVKIGSVYSSKFKSRK